jgi:hypothetical protein
MGMLSVHLLLYYARSYRAEVKSLVAANREREQVETSPTPPPFERDNPPP